jgi:hypothetical protein
VADLLGQALADVGGLSLTAAEAAVIAEALTAAVCEVFGAARAAQQGEALAVAVGALPPLAGEPLAAPAAAGSDPLEPKLPPPAGTSAIPCRRANNGESDGPIGCVPGQWMKLA